MKALSDLVKDSDSEVPKKATSRTVHSLQPERIAVWDLD